MVLPAFALALPYAAYIARFARTGTIEVMQEDFVRTARAKGLSERAVVLKHALKGAILPVVSFLGPAAAGILTGSFVVAACPVDRGRTLRMTPAEGHAPHRRPPTGSHGGGGRYHSNTTGSLAFPRRPPS